MNASTTTTAAEEVTFQSEAGNYRIVMEPMRRRQVGESNEIEVVGGRTLEFYDGVFKTSDPEEIEFLRKNASNGRYYWEIGSPEDKPTDASGLIKEIVKKGTEGDFTRVAEILVAERTATSRPDVLAACEAVLENGGEQLPAKPEAPLHELQRVRVGPTAGVTPGVSPDLPPGAPVLDPSSLETPPGAPATPADGSAVPPDQAPASEVSATDQAEGSSETMPSAQGPQIGGEPPAQGDATVTPEASASGEGADGAVPGGAPGAPAASEKTEG